MFTINKLKKYYGILAKLPVGIIAVFSMGGCEKMLDIPAPKSKIEIGQVFQDEATATAAVKGMYVQMIDPSGFASGSYSSITNLASMSSDEAIPYYPDNVEGIQFSENELLTDNSYIASLWNSSYKVIYQANAIVENLNGVSGFSSVIRDQLQGEAYFVRAFTYFYLVNFFGDVPLILSTDYKSNAVKKRDAIDLVLIQIEHDLLTATNLMLDTYSGTERVRPNRFAAKALLARFYLFKKDWDKAIDFSSEVIANNVDYEITGDFSQVFLSTSREAIWQISPVSPDFNTWEGSNFIIDFFPENNILRKSFVDSFDPADNRRINWIGEFFDGVDMLYFPYKYKVKFGTPVTEYSMVLRLAEQYLIRAEAETQLNQLSSAITDIDIIRYRAGLPLIHDVNPAINKADLMLAIEDENKFELFTEWGHRWLFLKRTELAASRLAGLKTGWSVNDELYPVPEEEFVLNPYLGDQNTGY